MSYAFQSSQSHNFSFYDQLGKETVLHWLQLLLKQLYDQYLVEFLYACS